jgi:hypothetical protein
MTQNKFWLVLTEKQAQEKFLTKEYAINDARELAQKRKKPMYLMECVKVFDVNVNIVETSFEATPEESSAVTEQDDTISVKPVLGLPEIEPNFDKKHSYNFFDKNELIKSGVLTEEPPKPKFKVGDRVLLDNYYDCIVDDYIYETKSYKVSIMGGGYNIAKEVRLSHRK